MWAVWTQWDGHIHVRPGKDPGTCWPMVHSKIRAAQPVRQFGYGSVHPLNIPAGVMPAIGGVSRRLGPGSYAGTGPSGWSRSITTCMGTQLTCVHMVGATGPERGSCSTWRGQLHLALGLTLNSVTESHATLAQPVHTWPGVHSSFSALGGRACVQIGCGGDEQWRGEGGGHNAGSRWW